jgi:type IV secretory pathway VirJ component
MRDPVAAFEGGVGRVAKKLLAGCAASLTLLLLAAAPALADDAGQLATPVLAEPAGPMRGVVLLFSDHGGLVDADRNAAAALAKSGALVAEIDSDAYLARLDALGEACHFLIPDIEKLSRQLQRTHHGATYHAPILAGRGLGGALAEAALVQAWPATIAGAVSLDPAGAIGSAKPFCGDPLGARPALQGFWSVGFTAATGRARIAALQAGGMPVEIGEATTLEALVLPHLPEVPEATDVADLPLIEMAADQPSDLLAIVISGDGGWRDIDMDLAESLRKSGVQVVGWDSLRYFWSEKTPERTAQDLGAVLQIYLAKFHATRVALIGYSFGADVLPFAFNRLPGDLQGQVVQMSLLGFAGRADFEITMTGWLGAPPSDRALPAAAEIAKLPTGMIQCFYGAEETDSACPSLPKGAEIVRMAGGHHFDGDYQGLAQQILAGFKRRSGR